MKIRKNLVGQRFGRLIVLRHSGQTPRWQTLWECSCECGNTKVVRGYCLTRGETTSCGCFCRENTSRNNSTHRKTRTRIYHIWCGMRERCLNPNHPFFHRYGGRGIVVCEEWGRFEGFYKDMGDPPSGMSIDRIDNNGNYEPGNCRWATQKTQTRNTSKNVMISIGGETQCLTDWCAQFNIKIATVWARRHRQGKSWEVAFGIGESA